MLLNKEESKLQKKGLNNLSKDELNIWIKICERNEKIVKYNKTRRSWRESREEAEKSLVNK